MLRYLYRLPELYQAGKWHLTEWMIELELRRFKRAVAESATLSDEEKHRRNERAMERHAAEWAAMMQTPVLDAVLGVVLGVVTIALFGWTLWHNWSELSFHIALADVGQHLLTIAKGWLLLGSIVALVAWLEGDIKLPGQR